MAEKICPKCVPLLDSRRFPNTLEFASSPMNSFVIVHCLCLSIAIQAGIIARGSSVEQSPQATGFAWWNEPVIMDLNGVRIPIAEGWMVLVFLDPDCPIANGYIPVLNSLSAQFSGRGVRLVGVYTDPAFDPERLRNHRRDFSIQFPVVQDLNGRLVRLTGASYSSEVAVLNGRGKVLYRGRIDNRVAEDGRVRPKATEDNLRNVLEHLGAGETGPFPEQKGFGCFLPEPNRQR
jgi:AhpC/TSA family